MSEIKYELFFSIILSSLQMSYVRRHVANEVGALSSLMMMILVEVSLLLEIRNLHSTSS